MFTFVTINYFIMQMLQKLFGFNAKETTVKTEIMAGITDRKSGV